MPHRVTLDDSGVEKVFRILSRRGIPVRSVGGAVRDLLAGRKPKDYDFATPALPEDVTDFAVEDGYRVVPTGLRHGTVTIVVDGVGFEVTTLRRDRETDGRHAEVEYVTDFATDAARRDFTMNALSASVEGIVHDYFGGVDDLMAGCVRFVGDPAARIAEDYLRILRMYRFRATFGSGIPDPTATSAIRELRDGLRQISGERLWQEVSRILPAQNGAREIRHMGLTGVLELIGLGAATAETLMDMESVRARGGGAAELVGVLLRDQAEVRAALGRYRTSSLEMERALLAAHVAGNETSSSHYWMSFVSDVANGEATPFKSSAPRIVSSVLAGTGRHEAAAAVMASVPRFPLSGSHLLSLGMPQGPDLGIMLGELRRSWKASGFSLSTDDLLAEAAARLSVGAPKP